MSTCPKCNGDEKIECPKCEGAGVLSPEQFVSLGLSECPKCNGSGEIVCTKCKGDGEI